MDIAQQFEAYLSQTCGLSKAAVAALMQISTAQHYSAEQNIVQQGQGCQALYFVAQGLVRYFIVTPDGAEVNKSIRIAPCVVGSTVALVKQNKSALSICGFSALDVMRIDWPEFVALMDDSHELERFYRRGMEAIFIEHESRELSLLMQTAQQRYEGFLQKYAAVIEAIPLYHVASFLGITPIALSRIRKRLGMSPRQKSQ